MHLTLVQLIIIRWYSLGIVKKPKSYINFPSDALNSKQLVLYEEHDDKVVNCYYIGVVKMHSTRYKGNW